MRVAKLMPSDLPSQVVAKAVGPSVISLVLKASRIKGIFLSSPWGDSVAVSTGTPGTKLIEIPIESGTGCFEIWLEFASAESRPLQIMVDGQTVVQNGARETTSGWMPEHQAWFRQVSLWLPAGEHIIGLQRERDFPHVRAVALVPVIEVVASEQAAIALERQASARATTLDWGELNDLARAAIPALRQMLAMRRSPHTIMAALESLTDALAWDVTEPQQRIGFSGPFGGQRERQKIFNRLDALFGFDALVETGAYFGTTTEMFAELWRPVFSCELHPTNYMRSLVRLYRYTNVELYNLDSREFLSRMAREHHDWKMPFFYLDAHWGADLPLPGEVTLIAENFRDFVIFVDDFKNSDSGYGFDNYGDGVELSLEFLIPRLSPGHRLEFLEPTSPAHLETGSRRGTLIIIPSHIYEAKLDCEPLLRRIRSAEGTAGHS